mmetsp:Transcript_28183/g.42669  ORF Transcript_28183/g.42669 Transcript_28183/m.42669 type:complete len:160 (+) Transcript_28183:2608-3087(+)
MQKFRNKPQKTIHKVIKVYEKQQSLLPLESNSVELPEEDFEASNMRYSKHSHMTHTQHKARTHKAQAISSIQTLSFQTAKQAEPYQSAKVQFGMKQSAKPIISSITSIQDSSSPTKNGRIVTMQFIDSKTAFQNPPKTASIKKGIQPIIEGPPRFYQPP